MEEGAILLKATVTIFNRKEVCNVSTELRIRLTD